MFPYLCAAQKHSQRDLHSRSNDLTDNTIEYRFISSAETSSSIPTVYVVGLENVNPSEAERTTVGMVSTRATVITIPSDGNDDGCPFYNMNDTANNAYNTPVDSPPAISRIRAIPLPLLSPNIPIQTHTLITYRPSVVPIYWNMSLPPSTARLTVNVGVGGRWSSDGAARPVVSSITVRIRGISRPIVIFPVEAGRPIRIIDILRGVYNVMRAEVLEKELDASDVLAYRAYEPGSREVSFNDAIAADAIQRHFHNRIWWWGLSPSPNEADVWIVHLRGMNRGRFHR